VHHAYRFEGPPGVGKELTAVALAQALLCTAGERLGCGRCDACRRASERNADEPVVPLHPDFIFVGRGIYPQEIIGKKETQEVSVEQIRRVVLAHAAYAPHEGRAKVFLIRDADELSISAANALLKTLEEPRQGTHFILLTSRPEKLLDTIRSRSLPVRFGPLPDDDLAAIVKARGLAPERLAEVVEMAAGSAATALEVADAELSAARQAFVAGLMRAVAAPDLAEAVAFSEAIERDRGTLLDNLQALAAAFAQRVRQRIRSAPASAELLARRYELVLDAIDSVERNGSSPLIVSGLITSLRHAEQRRPGAKPPIVLQRR
ncbi:MAG: AAA family ATPase, partial [Myxococcales bacterium]|nr:AAA family ATPase [Myxococcales bacterium]